VTLTIQYKGNDDSPISKIIKITREQADDFIQELNQDLPFTTLETNTQTITIPTRNITEIRIEEDETPISKSKGKKTPDMGSGEATKSS
jgi:hydrogenase maturation factor HypF (carbamoyltransferase family)